MTLLLNKGQALPIPPKSDVVVIGPYGDYGTAQGGVGGKLGAEITRLNGAAAAVVKGSGIAGTDRSGFGAATKAVSKADHIVLALGADPSKEHESMDRLTVTLPAIQSELALAVLAAAKAAHPPPKVTLVLFNWGEISTEELLGDLDGLLMAYMPHTSTAVAEVLCGAINPSGRLPYTIYPNNYTAQVDFLDMSLTRGLGRGYRYFKGQPLYGFGFGLSFSSFVFSSSKSDFGTCSAAGCASKRYNVHVCNQGSRAGSETVQLYMAPVVASLPSDWRAPLPKRRLLDFAKVFIAAGETHVVSFTVTDQMMQLIDIDGARKLVRGSYTLLFTNGHDQEIRDAYEIK